MVSATPTSIPSADELAALVAASWPALAGGALTPLPGGLINLTVRVEAPDGTPYVLQRLHPVFRPELHHDIAAVTAHLAARGLETPRLVPTAAGTLWVDAPDGCYRLQTFVPGETHERVHHPALARSAGALLGRFHVALADLAHEFHFVRVAHGLARHGAALEASLQAHRGHRLHARVARLAEGLLGAAARGPWPDGLPRRIVHGDPKISNFRFSPADRARALVDLDTLGWQDVPTELGDACRSFCNPTGEDARAPSFHLPTFAATMQGYAGAAGALLTAVEREAIVPSVRSVALELACRFAADALAECYFGWDPARYPGRGEHNLHRAEVQAALAHDLSTRQAEAETVVARAFAGRAADG